MNIPDDLRYSVEHEWVRVEGGTGQSGRHRLRPGRARRHRLRRPARSSEPRGGRWKARRSGVDQVGVGDLRAAGRHDRRRQRLPADGPSASTRIPTARGGSASWSSPRATTRRCPARRRRPTVTSPRSEQAGDGPGAGRGTKRARRLPLVAVFCNNCGHGTPRASTSARRAATPLLVEWRGCDNHPATHR